MVDPKLYGTLHMILRCHWSRAVTMLFGVIIANSSSAACAVAEQRSSDPAAQLIAEAIAAREAVFAGHVVIETQSTEASAETGEVLCEGSGTDIHIFDRTTGKEFYSRKHHANIASQQRMDSFEGRYCFPTDEGDGLFVEEPRGVTLVTKDDSGRENLKFKMCFLDERLIGFDGLYMGSQQNSWQDLLDASNSIWAYKAVGPLDGDTIELVWDSPQSKHRQTMTLQRVAGVPVVTQLVGHDLARPGGGGDFVDLEFTVEWAEMNGVAVPVAQTTISRSGLIRTSNATLKWLAVNDFEMPECNEALVGSDESRFLVSYDFETGKSLTLRTPTMEAARAAALNMPIPARIDQSRRIWTYSVLVTCTVLTIIVVAYLAVRRRKAKE